MFCNNEGFTVHFTSPEACICASLLVDMSFWISYDIMQPTDQIRYVFWKMNVTKVTRSQNKIKTQYFGNIRILWGESSMWCAASHSAEILPFFHMFRRGSQQQEEPDWKLWRRLKVGGGIIVTSLPLFLYKADQRQEPVADFLPSTDNIDFRMEECEKVIWLVSIF